MVWDQRYPRAGAALQPGCRLGSQGATRAGRGEQATYLKDTVEMKVCDFGDETLKYTAVSAVFSRNTCSVGNHTPCCKETQVAPGCVFRGQTVGKREPPCLRTRGSQPAAT